jgi:GMP synthase (glutamine-hydrolysing)
LTTLVVDNLSPFTDDILDCMIKLDEKYVYKKYSEVGNIYDNNNILYDKVILSGRRKNIKEINIVNSKIIRDCFQTDKPILGICYGAEIIALTFGGSIYRMDDHVRGTIIVNILKPNSLIPDRTSVNVYENHRYSVAKLPKDFVSLGSSSLCKYEIFSHIKKRIFGTQFHPEKSDRDGFALLSKFMQL